ncbi:unnamed protein product [Calypogeia fissa]
MAPAAINIHGIRKPLTMANLGLYAEPVHVPVSGVVTKDPEEFDFEDVFGPVSNSHHSLVLTVVVEDDDDVDTWPPPPVECTTTEADALALKVRSHSLVGPSPRPGLSRQGPRAWDDLDHQVASGTSVRADSSTIVEKPAPALSDSSDSGSENGAEDDNGMSELNCEDGTQSGKLGPHDFELLACVGQGGFAKVFQCRKNGTDEIYAMKVMTKSKIMEKNHGGYMKAERDILTKVVHPFIVQLQYSFQTRTKLYLILDFINGGHLFFQLYRQGTFSEELARIYTAEIVCAVSHLHDMGIMHRDLKPENILLDAEGHVKLTDFGLAKEVDDSTKSNSLCGTVEYMAPEIMLAKGHGKAADWWSVGVLLYEMLTGQPPFINANRHKLQQKIVKDKIKLPTYLTSEATTLLKGLLQKDPSKRLGSGPKGSDEIKQHKWFKSINWRKVVARELQPKFRPTVNGLLCTANFDEMWTKLPLQDSPASTPKGEDTNFFMGYTYIAPNPYLPTADD